MLQIIEEGGEKLHRISDDLVWDKDAKIEYINAVFDSLWSCKRGILLEIDSTLQKTI